MQSLTKQEAQERLDLECEYLSDGDNRLNQNVYLEFVDGTKLFFAWAYLLKGLGEEWIGIVTREHGCRLYSRDGLQLVMVGDHFEVNTKIMEVV